MHTPVRLPAIRQHLQRLGARAERSLPAQLQAELAAGLLCGRSADGTEALRASLEKRLPIFSGK